MFNRFHSGWFFALLAFTVAAPSFGAPLPPVGPGQPVLTEPEMMSPTSTQSESSENRAESSALNRSDARHQRLDPLDIAPRAAPPLVPKRLESERFGSERLGSERLGSERLGSERLGSERLGSERLGSTSGKELNLRVVRAAESPENAEKLERPNAQSLNGPAATPDASSEVSQQPDPSGSTARGPPARTLFARSQTLDVTQPISVSQILILDQAIEAGTRLKIMAYNALGTWYQTTDPLGPNYVELSYPETGLWTAVLPESTVVVQRELAFELATGYFEAGTMLEIRYQRLHGPRTLEEGLSLPIAIQLSRSADWQLLPGERREFAPGPAIELKINVDQQIEVNQSFNLSVQPIDEHGNATSVSIESFDLLLNNKLLQEVNIVNNKYTVQNLKIKTPGRHQFSARSPAGGLQSGAETVWISAHKPEQIIWTDFSERSLHQLIAALPVKARITQNAAQAVAHKTDNPFSLSKADQQADRRPKAQGRASLNVLNPRTMVEESASNSAVLNNTPTETFSRYSQPSSDQPSTAPARPTSQGNETMRDVQTLTVNPQHSDQGSVVPSAQRSPPSDRAMSSSRVEDSVRTSLDSKIAASDPRQTSISQTAQINRAAPELWARAASDVNVAQPKITGPGIQPASRPPEPLTNGLYTNLQAIKSGGQSTILVVGDTALHIAQPELTTDRRRRSFDLVEQLSGPSGHQWLSDYFADLGQTFGIISRRTSFQPRTHRLGPQTAIVVRPGQTWLDALANGQSYVSSGAMASLSFSVNGALFGRTPHEAQRALSITVSSIERPLWARIYRNGNLLKQLPFKPPNASREPSAGLKAEQAGRLFLYLESDSHPFALGLTEPRNGREWLGQLRLQDMTLIANTAGQSKGRSGQRILESRDQKQLDFLTWTHGTGALMQVDFTHQDLTSTLVTPRTGSPTELTAQARQSPRDAPATPGVTLEIAEGYEDLTYFDPNRPPAATPSFTERFDLDALRGQGIRRTLSIDGYLDQISLWVEGHQLSDPIAETPPTHQVAHLDRMGGRPGDYYTCHILLRDGTELFSSPIFVGGFDRQ